MVAVTHWIGRRAERVKLKLDTLSFPLVTRVIDRTSLDLRVEQPLAFLRLGTGVVDQEGRSGTISAVETIVEGDIPSLVITVDYSLAAPVVAPTGAEPVRISRLEVIGDNAVPEVRTSWRDDVTIPFGYLPSQPSLKHRDSVPPRRGPKRSGPDTFAAWYDSEPSEGCSRPARGGRQGLTLAARARALAASVWERCRPSL
jgi:hypothetical protein